MWRERVGEIPGVKELTFSSGTNIGGDAPLSFNLIGSNFESLEAAARELEQKLGEYDGVLDIRNSIASGGEEIKLSIKPEAEALGLTMSSLGRHVRQAFYGEEAQRIQRGKDELRVMVRYPIEERRSIADLENMRIRTPTGDEVPFGEVAEVSFGKGYSTISRIDRQRTITVEADIDPAIVEPAQIIRTMSTEFIPELLGRYPGVQYGLERVDTALHLLGTLPDVLEHLLVFDDFSGRHQACQRHDVAAAVEQLVVDLDRAQHDHRGRYQRGADQRGQ